MTPARFIARRTPDWKELEALLARFENRRDRKLDSGEIRRFVALYRMACTDLSLAGAFRLPREMQSYLEHLVSRSHNNLYSHSQNRPREFVDFFLRRIPVEVYHDIHVRINVILFFLIFGCCLILGYKSQNFADLVVGEATLQQYYEMHKDAHKGQSLAGAASAAGFYIYNNVGINLTVFGTGILGGVGSLLVMLINAVYLGVIMGYLFSTAAAPNLLLFITAHAPFELTAIGISAGAGMRIGFSFIAPEGRRRLRALREESRNAIPIITAAALLTALAAFLEAIIGPSQLPLVYRAIIALICTLFMLVYFIIGGRHEDCIA